MNNISSLKHIEVNVKNSKSKVFILDNGAIIDSEAEAMLQALHSRSTGGFKVHLKILEEKGADNFMSKFYVGYGHKSIGDCGSTTIFIESISMLAAKAIQDSKLYNGQEASTRYINFSKQDFINPFDNEKKEKGFKLLEKQRKYYLSLLEPVKEYLKIQFPINEDENTNIYNKAITAKAFDICRGYLPSGASTNLAWHTNLRQIADRLLFLRHHPLEEVRNIAYAIEKAVLEKYPNSFSDKRYENTEKYQEEISRNYYYNNKNIQNFEIGKNCLDKNRLKKFENLFKNRPEKTELPSFLNDIGELEFSFKLDFGSFRDIQRHRAINQRMPLVTADLGFNKFYMNSLPKQLQEKTKNYLNEIEQEIKKLDIDEKIAQYYIPMGYNISNHITGTIPAMIYMAELRATRFVHPTLRIIAQKIATYINDEIGIKTYTDNEQDRFDIKRGEHDIVIEK